MGIARGCLDRPRVAFGHRRNGLCGPWPDVGPWSVEAIESASRDDRLKSPRGQTRTFPGCLPSVRTVEKFSLVYFTYSDLLVSLLLRPLQTRRDDHDTRDEDRRQQCDDRKDRAGFRTRVLSELGHIPPRDRPFRVLDPHFFEHRSPQVSCCDPSGSTLACTRMHTGSVPDPSGSVALRGCTVPHTKKETQARRRPRSMREDSA